MKTQVLFVIVIVILAVTAFARQNLKIPGLFGNVMPMQEYSISPTPPDTLIQPSQVLTTAPSITMSSPYAPETTTVPCGGKRGLRCPEGFHCFIPKQGLDMLGTCVR